MTFRKAFRSGGEIAMFMHVGINVHGAEGESLCAVVQFGGETAARCQELYLQQLGAQ